ncbi:hypothetical protein LSTR_LSTR017249 [Laodelphax striatellus]|uniref:14-3-3 domain-containing protein n=1 Tax=Laodelphax striatellus TaxID=195883 RepID=A0A482WMW0_LAOST|nr:hypothetical protein LSTR_LSTR017249 [Laodelphax striatellus]
MCERNEIFKAKLAEQAERYGDVIDVFRKLITEGLLFDVEERNLLSTAYKHEVSVRRSSLQVLISINKNEARKNSGGDKLIEAISDLKKITAKEIQTFCLEIISLLDNFLLPSAIDLESSVFYLRMKGDHWRYIAEISNSYFKRNAIEQSIVAYKCASEIAILELPPYHPTRLGVALNFSVLLYEILNSPHRACRMCSAAFYEAIHEIDTISHLFYKDSTLILQLMNDNLMLWLADIIEKVPDKKS